MPILRKRRNKEYQRAAQLLVDGHVEQAVGALRAILESNPEYTDAMVSLAVALMERQKKPDLSHPDTKEALGLLDRAIQLSPKDPIPLFNKAVIQRKLGRLQEAIVDFEAALRIEKKQPLALLHLAEIHYEMENWDKAIEYARLALIRDPGLAEAMTWVKDALQRAGRLKGNTEQAERDN